MAEGQFILYIRKVIVNPLLGRKQMVSSKPFAKLYTHVSNPELYLFFFSVYRQLS